MVTKLEKSSQPSSCRVSRSPRILQYHSSSFPNRNYTFSSAPFFPHHACIPSSAIGHPLACLRHLPRAHSHHSAMPWPTTIPDIRCVSSHLPPIRLSDLCGACECFLRPHSHLPTSSRCSCATFPPSSPAGSLHLVSISLCVRPPTSTEALCVSCNLALHARDHALTRLQDRPSYGLMSFESDRCTACSAEGQSRESSRPRLSEERSSRATSSEEKAGRPRLTEEKSADRGSRVLVRGVVC